MKRKKPIRIKHNPDVHLVPLLPLEAVEKLKRGATIRNKKQYVRRNKKQELKSILDGE